MKISVNEQTQQFYLACHKWEPVVGHEIRVGKYRFCAIPVGSVINISEVTSGARVISIPLSPEIYELTSSKEDSMNYLLEVGQRLKNLIEKIKDFDERLAKMKQASFESLGEMPPIENYDSDWMFADESDVLH